MPTPTWVNWGTFVDGTGAVSPGIPSGTTSGDVMILYVETGDDQPATPSGWTLGGTWTGGVAGSTFTRLTVFYKTAGGSESAPSVGGTGDHTNAIIHSFRDVEPNGVAFQGGSGGLDAVTAVTVPPVDVNYAPALVAVAVANGGDVASTTFVSGVTNTSLESFTGRSSNNRASGNGGGITVYTGNVVNTNTIPRSAGHMSGLTDFGPENLLSTTVKCAAAGHWPEVDVRVSADATPWLMHDFEVDRTTNGTGALKDLTDAYLGTLIADGTSPSEGIPKLRDILNAVKTAHPTVKVILHYNAGFYPQDHVEAIQADIDAAGMNDRVLFASWLQGHLEAFNNWANSAIPRILFPAASDTWWDPPGTFYQTAVMPSMTQLTTARVDEAATNGIEVMGSTGAVTADYTATWQAGCSLNLVNSPNTYRNWTDTAFQTPQSGYTYATLGSSATYAYVQTILTGTTAAVGMAGTDVTAYNATVTTGAPSGGLGSASIQSTAYNVTPTIGGNRVMPAWVMWGSFAAGIGDVSPSLPTGWAEGDLFILFVENWPGTSGSPESAPSAPAGWTSMGTPASSGASAAGTNTRLSAFYRRATASESAPTVTDPGDHCAAIIHAFRGVKVSGNPWNVLATSTETTLDTSVTYPSVTTTVDDCLIVHAVSAGWDATGNAFFNADLSNGALTDLQTQSGNGTNTGNGCQLSIATGGKGTAGSTGSTTQTCDGNTEKAMWTIALQPGQDIGFAEQTTATATVNAPKLTIKSSPVSVIAPPVEVGQPSVDLRVSAGTVVASASAPAAVGLPGRFVNAGTVTATATAPNVKTNLINAGHSGAASAASSPKPALGVKAQGVGTGG